VSSGKKTSVKVEILGESYVLRTEAAPEHTKAVAEHLDKSIRQIL
jgi:cell division protein ZapA